MPKSSPGHGLARSLVADPAFGSLTGHGGAFGAAATDAIAALLATAMGVQNAVARKLAVPDLTTTVLTMTLTGLGADLRAVFTTEGKAERATVGRRLLAVVTMIVGAAADAALVLRVSPLSALALATALLAVVAAGAALAARRPTPWRGGVLYTA